MQIITNDKTNTVSLLNLTWEELFSIQAALIRMEENLKVSKNINSRVIDILDNIDFAEDVVFGKVEEDK